MAKYGEGDKRWIVEERPDGANVHNWHWAETNCFDWSKNLLSNLFQDLIILNGEANLWITTTKLQKIEGEAYVNIRKGKIIPGYEISLSISWQGEAKDSDGKSLLKVDGTVDLPYIADENADEDPEIKITVKDDGPIGKRLKEAFLSKGKSIVLEKIRVYVQSMAAGGPAKDELEVKKKVGSQNDTAAEKSNSKSKQSVSSSSSTTTTVDGVVPVQKKEEKKGFKKISLTEKFHCRAKDVYDTLMDENRWKGFTQSNAKISREIGGPFSLFDGSITGVNQELQDGKLIVQKWRFGSWPDGVYSTVRLVFEEPEPGLAIVRLTQIDVPEEDRYGNATVVENTERGWRELIFHKIRAVFGFGI